MNRYKDWMEQALRDYEKASVDYAHGYYEWACFTCQQAAKKRRGDGSHRCGG